jgi:hypothetical protein
MVEELLVESEIADSVTLVKTLDRRGDAPSIVVWHYFSDAEEWRLLVAGPTFDSLLPGDEARAYLKIAEAVNDAQVASLTIGKVKVERTTNPLLSVATTLVHTDPRGIVRAHFKGVSINGIFVKEMVVLRAA